MTFKPIAQSILPSAVSGLPSTAPEPKITRLAVERASLLLGCYRAGDAADPEIYAASVAAMLASYPDDVAIAVTDPIRGIPSTSKFLPTVSEIRDACERAMQPRYEAAQREAERKRTQAQLDERRRWEADRAAVREQDIAKLEQCCAELRKAPDPMATDREREDKVRARINERLDRIREEYCSVETPSGIKVSPMLKAYLDQLATQSKGTDAA